jgi:hypothetical protein
MKGKVLKSLPQPDIAEAKRCLLQALELSRNTGATAWELRAAIDLAELIEREDAKRLLRSALDGFAKGSETADIKAANEILKRA